ncbi:MAG: hypothetical protein H0X29_01260 [Parachlamydiaceae bacterium]|nr:hypothetical protein [Parachlamydiaceae bacterium]
MNLFLKKITFCLILTFSSILHAENLPAPAISANVHVPLLPVKDPAALIGNELSRIDNLIEATQQSLEDQKQLREKIVEYQKIQESYLLHPKDNELLFRMIKSAYATLKSIQDNHLEHNFDPEFISELKVFAQVASKRGIPKP